LEYQSLIDILHVKPIISIQHIKKAFSVKNHRFEVIKNINVTINQGEFVSFVGPSGCGKTTLLNIIAGLESPDSGSVIISTKPSTEMLGKVGYMHQKDGLLPWRNVLDNAILGLEINGFKRPEAHALVRPLLKQFGLEGFEEAMPWEISGGMRQRVALLRTVSYKPEVVLLDEPFGALDALTREDLQFWLLQISQELNQTVIMITHDIEEALILSDQVFVLSHRPSFIIKNITVPFKKNKNERNTTNIEFANLKAELSHAIRQ
jgi:ABC-type nitrate/sulfonate/bicarbonate transport system ATPase subunit